MKLIITLAALLLAPLMTLSAAAEFSSLPLPLLDAYGGAMTIKADATGYFWLKEINGRWFFITPEGHGFIPLGVNHLISYFGGEQGRLRASELNLVQELDGGDSRRAAERVEAMLRDWRFNCAGYDAPKAFQQRMPFSVGFIQVRASAVIHDVQFVDVFGPAFAHDLENRVAALCQPLRENRHLLGYYLADLPLWGDRKFMDREEQTRGASWLSFFRKLPAEAPGRQAYEKFLAGRYAGRFDVFKKLYVTAAAGFGEPLHIDFDTTDRRAAEVVADDEAFVAAIAGQIYRLTSEAFHRHDPYHLVLGERFLGDRLFLPVLEMAAKYFPVVAVQLDGGFPKELFAGLYRRWGRPLISVDHVISFVTPQTPNVRGRPLQSESEAAAFYVQYLRDAFAEPFMVGYNRCQLVTRIRLDGPPPVYKQGLLDPQGRPYATLVQAVRAANCEALARLYAPVKAE